MGWRQEHHALFALDGGHVGDLGVRQPRGQRDEYGYAVGVTPLHRLRDQLVNLPWETLWKKHVITQHWRPQKSKLSSWVNMFYYQFIGLVRSWIVLNLTMFMRSYNVFLSGLCTCWTISIPWEQTKLPIANCLDIFDHPGHVRKLPVAWGFKAVFFAGHYGFLHHLQLARQCLAAIQQKGKEKRNYPQNWHSRIP